MAKPSTRMLEGVMSFFDSIQLDQKRWSGDLPSVPLRLGRELGLKSALTSVANTK
jgi:hypothetical protein